MTGDAALTPQTRLAPAASTLIAAVGDEACLLDTASGAYFMLNRVGSVIWGGLQSGQTLEEIHRSLLERFSVAGDILWNDLQLFVQTLQVQGLISVDR